jgi:hypothetical protein
MKKVVTVKELKAFGPTNMQYELVLDGERKVVGFSGDLSPKGIKKSVERMVRRIFNVGNGDEVEVRLL